MKTHEDLHDIYVEGGFDKDFKFTSEGKTYKFHAETFNSLLKEYGEQPLIDCISTINGSIKHMLDDGICTEIS